MRTRDNLNTFPRLSSPAMYFLFTLLINQLWFEGSTCNASDGLGETQPEDWRRDVSDRSGPEEFLRSWKNQ